MMLTLMPFLLVSVWSVTSWPWGVRPKGLDVTEPVAGAAAESAQAASGAGKKEKSDTDQRRKTKEGMGLE